MPRKRRAPGSRFARGQNTRTTQPSSPNFYPDYTVSTADAPAAPTTTGSGSWDSPFDYHAPSARDWHAFPAPSSQPVNTLPPPVSTLTHAFNNLPPPVTTRPRPVTTYGRLSRPVNTLPRPDSPIPCPVHTLPRPSSPLPRPLSILPRLSSPLPRPANPLARLLNTLPDLPIPLALRPRHLRSRDVPQRPTIGANLYHWQCAARNCGYRNKSVVLEEAREGPPPDRPLDELPAWFGELCVACGALAEERCLLIQVGTLDGGV